MIKICYSNEQMAFDLRVSMDTTHTTECSHPSQHQKFDRHRIILDKPGQTKDQAGTEAFTSLDS
jgi:hypothetical protein